VHRLCGTLLHVVLPERLAADVLDGLDSWVTRVVDRIGSEVPQLVRDDAAAELAVASTRGLLEEFAATLGTDESPGGYQAPPAALAFARHLARTDGALSGLLRSYRLGQELLFGRGADLADASDTQGLRAVGLHAFRFVDSIVGEVTEAFEREREAALRGSALRRERLVARLLAGENVPSSEVERVLGWRMAGRHLAAIAWPPDPDADGALAGSALRRVLAWAGEGNPLTMPGAAGEVHAWVKPTTVDRASPPPEVVATLAETGVRVVFGEPGPNLAGFISSRREADAARKVARHLPRRSILSYGEVALLHLLLADPAAASAFVRSELGPLADEKHAVIRATVRAFLEHGQDSTAAARELGLHRNTVMRRLHRAGQLIGHALEDRPAEIAVAIMLRATTVLP
jgi:hypothetical protein